MPLTSNEVIKSAAEFELFLQAAAWVFSVGSIIAVWRIYKNPVRSRWLAVLAVATAAVSFVLLLSTYHRGGDTIAHPEILTKIQPASPPKQ